MKQDTKKVTDKIIECIKKDDVTNFGKLCYENNSSLNNINLLSIILRGLRFNPNKNLLEIFIENFPSKKQRLFLILITEGLFNEDLLTLLSEDEQDEILYQTYINAIESGKDLKVLEEIFSNSANKPKFLSFKTKLSEYAEYLDLGIIDKRFIYDNEIDTINDFISDQLKKPLIIMPFDRHNNFMANKFIAYTITIRDVTTLRCGVYESDPMTVDHILEKYKISGVYLPGGSDIPQQYYQDNEDPIKRDYRTDVEMRLIELAKIERLPLLAICRGHQAMWVSEGGKLTELVGTGRKILEVKSDKKEIAKLYGLKSGDKIFSAHHQMALQDSTPKTINIIAESAEVIEAIVDSRVHESRRFALGVQFHPEEDGFSKDSIDIFTRYVRLRHSEIHHSEDDRKRVIDKYQLESRGDGLKR